MSELKDVRIDQNDFRWRLLTTVSALALIGVVSSHEAEAANDETDRPTVWIELGGQLERVDSPQAISAPPFFGQAASVNLDPMIEAQRPSRYSIGGESKIAFAPENTDWVFSAAIRYGRSNNARHLHKQTNLPTPSKYLAGFGHISATLKPVFGDGQTNFSESHFILDFQAGKDVGLGLFGVGGSSVVSAGVRFAQFTSSSDATLHARVVKLTPVSNPGKYKFDDIANQTNTAILHANRNTHAIGPSVSWDASLPVAGNGTDMTFAFDWGVNAAVLFGRQRTQVHHQTTGDTYQITFQHTSGLHPVTHTNHYARATAHDRSRTVMIPNVGGFAGLSLKFSNAKVSLGYRGDFFFGAVDNGIDTRHEADQNFYGPFATISIGL